MRQITLCATVLALLLLPASPATAEVDEKPLICVLPLGKYNSFLLGKAVSGIKHLYDFPVRVLKSQPMPQEAFYRPRKRHRADKLLHIIDRDFLPDSGCKIIIGFTRQDISVTKGAHKDWGIFGLGSISGTSAMVSTKRLGKKANKKKRAVRTIKVMNHELGHVLGLPHCSKKQCLMNDAKGTIKTVDKETGLFCDLCKGEIERRHKTTLPAHKEIDWKSLVK
jgi:archaemetzincin